MDIPKSLSLADFSHESMQADRHLYDFDPELSRETFESIARDFFGKFDKKKDQRGRNQIKASQQSAVVNVRECN